MVKIAVLASGNGSNFQALVNAKNAKKLDVEIVCLIADNRGAYVLERAQRAGIQPYIIPRDDFSDPDRFFAAITNVLTKHQVDLVCLAGYMQILGKSFVNEWKDKVLNIHPSLLPAFKGKDSILKALEAGVKLAGCTVHYVTEALDSGPILAQAAIPVYDDDDLETLTERMHEAEHRCYVYAINLLIKRQASLSGTKTTCPLSSISKHKERAVPLLMSPVM